MPVPNDLRPQPVDRQAALASAALVETVEAACERWANGGQSPAHYAPTAPDPDGPKGTVTTPTVYGKGAEAKAGR